MRIVRFQRIRAHLTLADNRSETNMSRVALLARGLVTAAAAP